MKFSFISSILVLSSFFCIAQAPTTDLVAHFPFDGNTINSTGVNVTATGNNISYTTNKLGVPNKAIEMAGNLNSFVEYFDNGNFDFSGSNDFTITFGFFYNSNTYASGLFDNGLNYGGIGVWFWQNTPGIFNIQFNYKNNSAGSTAASAFSLNQWHHVVATRNNGTLKVYIDGVFRISAPEGTTPPAYPLNPISGAMAFSSYSPPRYNPFVGKLDELRIYNRSLSEAEISAVNNEFSGLSCQANITADGPTGFCTGGSVTLTASEGNSYLWSNGATTRSITVSTAGSYSVTITDGFGCSATSAATTVSVGSIPVIGNISGPSNICVGGTTQLTVPSGSGGSVTSSGGYDLHSFTSSGSFTSNAASSVEVLVVAGGGAGGGGNGGGGGGAGGLVHAATYPVTSGVAIPVSVGAGGLATGGTGDNGQNSVFDNIIAIGGGGGGNCCGNSSQPGGSGGGIGRDNFGGSPIGASALQTNSGGGIGYGNKGGNFSVNGGTGGGGSGAAGGNSVGDPSAGGHGGIGKFFSQFSNAGSPLGWYAGGGGGSLFNSSFFNSGGNGGGGRGTNTTSSSVAGVAGTGGGGGGGAQGTGWGSPPRSGGSGIVIVRIANPPGIWSSEDPGIASVSSSGLVSGQVAGTTTINYTVTVSGCVTVKSYTITIVQPNPPSPIHARRCGPGTITVSATSQPGETIDWYSNPTGGLPLFSSNNSYTSSLSSSTTYYAEARNLSLGCKSATRTPVTATIDPVPVVTISASGPTTFCPGGSVTLTAANAISYLWNTNETTASIIVQQSGTYTVIGTTNGCNSNPVSITVTVQDILAPNVITKPATIYLDANGQALLSPSDVDNGSTDNCAISSFSVTPNSFNCSNLSTPLTITQTIPTDLTWRISTTSSGTGLCNTGFWSGVGSLPSTATYSQAPSLGAAHVGSVPGAQTLFAANGVRYYRKTFNLVSLTNIKATLFMSVDNAIHIFINGTAVALEGNLANENFDGNPSRLILNSTGPNINGGGGYQGFDSFTGTNASSLFVLGANEIVLAVANCDGGDNGGVAFLAGLESSYYTTTPVTLTVTDASNNSASAPASVIVLDNSGPSIICPPNITAPATSTSGAIVNYVVPVGTDNCPGATTTRIAGPASGSNFPIGTTSITYKVTDAGGLTAQCSFTVTVTNVAPAIVCPAVIITNNANGQCDASVNFAATETTGIPVSTITYSQNPGTFFAVGTTTVTATATNSVGSSSCTFTVTVNDIQPPVITLNGANGSLTTLGSVNTYPTSIPGSSTGGLSHAHGIAYDLERNTVWVTDDDLGDDIFEFPATQPSGTTLSPIARWHPALTSTIEGVAFDATDNTLWIVDYAGYVGHFDRSGAVLPGAFNVGAIIPPGAYGSRGMGIALQNNFIWIDNGVRVYKFNKSGGAYTGFNFLTNQVGITYDPERNLLWTSGWYDGIYRAWNPNTGTLVFSSAPVPIIQGHDMSIGAGRIWVASENANRDFIYSIAIIGGAIDEIVECHSSYTDPGYATTDNCPNPTTTVTGFVDPNSVGTYTLTYTATDQSNNSTSVSRTVTVLDRTAPVPNVANLPIGGGQCQTNLIPPTATDACMGIITATTNVPLFINLQGTHIVTWRYDDGNGNFTTQNQTFIIRDVTRPQIACPANITVIATSAAGAIVNYVAPVGTDNCSGAITTRTAGPASGSIFPIGTTTITYKVTDVAGQTAECSFTITVLGVAPVISCPANITVNNLYGQCGANVSFAATETIAIPASTITYSHNPGSFFPVGTTTVTATATNVVGTSVCTLTVTVIDNQPPVIECAPAMTINTAPGLCTGSALLTPPTVTDNCEGFGNALSFNGGYASVPDALILNPFNEWTLECWVRLTTTGIQQSFVEKYNNPGSNYGYLIRVLSSDKVLAGVVFGCCGGYFITGTTSLVANQWYHVATTVNRATGTMKLYVNGSQEAQITTMAGIPVNPNNASLKLGARGDDAATRLTNGGLLDEVRIWNVERTQVQLQTFMNSELIPQPGLIALYPFNQGIPGGNNAGLTNVIDDSGNNLNGTLNGFVLNGPTSNWVAGRAMDLTVTNNAPPVYPLGNTIVTWTAVDASGNQATCTQVVTVIDNQAPVPDLPSLPAVNAECAATLVPSTATDACMGTIIGTTNDPVNYSSQGTYTVVWNYNDGNGNSSSQTQTVTIHDVTPPVIICSPDVTINTTPGRCTGTTTLVAPQVSDNCNNNGLSFGGGYVQAPDHPSLNPFNEWTLECWVRLTTTGIQQSFVEKYNNPGSHYGYLIRVLSSDKVLAGVVFGCCGGYFITGTTSLLANQWYHVATSVNRSTGTMKLYVNGVLEAQINTMAGIPVQPNTASLKLGARGDDAATRLVNGGTLDEVRVWSVERSQAQIQATMNSEINAQPGLVALYHLNQGIPGGNNMGLTTVIDDSGNNNNGSMAGFFALSGTTSNWVNGHVGGSGSIVTVTNNAPVEYPIGNTTVTWTATDGSGNSSTCTQTVTVVDNQPPIINCPANISVIATSAAGATVNYITPVGTDNCPGAVTIRTAGLAGGSTFPIGTTTVTYKVTDAGGLTAECSFTVTVVGIAPVITAPSTIVVNNIPGQCGGNVGFVATETTGIPASVITYSIAPGSYFPVGTTSVIATATNAVGTSSTVISITVIDNEPPTISGPSNITVTATSAAGAVVTYPVPVGIDNCSGSITVLGSGSGGGGGGGASGSTFPIGTTTVTYTVTDASGNTAQYSFTVTVVGIPPANNCPANIIINNTPGQCGANVNFEATETTGIPASTISYSHAPGSFFPVGTTIVTATATNAVGSSVCTFIITVTDNEPPFINVSDKLLCYEDGNFGCSVNLGATATDNCQVISLVNNAPACFPVGTTVVGWTATDNHGNVSTKTQTVVRNPEINISVCASPTLTIYTGTVSGFGPFGPQSINLSSSASGGTQGYSYSWSPSTGLSNPTIANPVASPVITTTYTLTVTDSKGCTRSVDITINVLPLSDAICSGSGNNVKFNVCHIPPGNPPNPQNICISPSGLNAHLVGGTVGHNNCYLGPCGQQLCFSTEPGIQTLVSRPPSREEGGKPIVEAREGFYVKAYPNPSATDFRLVVDTDSDEPIHVRIVDLNGVVRSKLTHHSNDGTIVVGAKLNSGMYIAEITQGKNRKLLKLVKAQ